MQAPKERGAPQDIPAPTSNGYPYSNINSSSPEEHQHEDLRTQQIESLEQALALQINKRIEAETLTKYLRGTQTNLKDLQELTDAFVSEVDALDGDDSEEQMERRDVLWMLKEVHLRVNDVTSNGNGNGNGSDGNRDSGITNDIQEEMNVAMLHGQIAQLKETNQRLQQQQQQHHRMNGSPNSKSMNTNGSEIMKQYKTLQEKHTRLEQRHGNIMKEMQESLNAKNQEISQLKKEREHPSSDQVASPPPQSQLKTPAKTPNQIHPMSPISPFFTSPHKDLQIASLQEEIEDRNLVIQDLSQELDGLVAKTNVQSMEADKVKIRYLESILKDLEGKLHLEQMRAARANDRARSHSASGICVNVGAGAGDGDRHGNGIDYARNDSENTTISVSSPKYGSMGWNMGNTGWDASCSSLIDEKFVLAPGAVQSSMMEDMELKIAELMERLRDAQEENLMLKEGRTGADNAGKGVVLESTRTVQ